MLSENRIPGIFTRLASAMNPGHYAILVLMFSCLWAYIAGIHEETYQHFTSSYFSDENNESHGYLYYYQINVIHRIVNPILKYVPGNLNWYNIVVTLLCLVSSFFVLKVGIKNNKSFKAIPVLFLLSVVFSVNILNVHNSRAAVMCAFVCFMYLFYERSLIACGVFLILGLLMRNELFGMSFVALVPFLWLSDLKFSMGRKLMLAGGVIIPIIMFIVVNITRYQNHPLQYTYEKRLDTGGFLYMWTKNDQVQDSMDLVKYSTFERNILADTVNLSEDYLTQTFVRSDVQALIENNTRKLNWYFDYFTDYSKYPILSLYAFLSLLTLLLYPFAAIELRAIYRKLILANAVSFFIICGVSAVLKFEPAFQETFFSFIAVLLLIQILPFIDKYKKTAGVLLLSAGIAILVYEYRINEPYRHLLADIKIMREDLKKECKGKLILPMGTVFNHLMWHPNPFVLNDNKDFKGIVDALTMGFPLFDGYSDKIREYFDCNILYNLELMQKIIQCNSCNSIILAYPSDVQLYEQYYRMVYQRDLKFTQLKILTKEKPDEEAIGIYDVPVLGDLTESE